MMRTLREIPSGPPRTPSHRGLFVPAFACLPVFILAAVAAPPTTPEPPRLEVDFSPGPPGSLRARLAREIRGARETIDIALYTGMTVETALGLVRSARDGRQVRVLVDSEAVDKAPDDASRAPDKGPPRWLSVLAEAGVPVRTLPADDGTGAERPAFHHKFAVIDAGTVLTGSWNWSARGDGTNYENLVVIRDAPLARRFAEQFEQLWTGAIAPATSIAIPDGNRPGRERGVKR
jgi:phosphatidylserine/phosphatidylglycerophosphate/cardiolipin synthase-like enzyme